MTNSFPYLAMDSAGKRTILCDYRIKMFDNTTKKETTKMKTLSADQLTRYVGIRIRSPAAADRYWARCMGQDSAMDDETIEKLKSFLQSKLHPSDHAAACALMDGGEAEDTELPENTAGKEIVEKTPGAKVLAGDAKPRADFFKHYPDAARIRIDNSGIPHRQRAASYSADAAASFAAMFPDAMKIGLR